jgi:hypothetical protein
MSTPVPNRFALFLFSHVVETGGDMGGFVNFLPLAVASEPRPPLVHLVVEPDTGLPVVHLLAAEALIASHKGGTGQSGTGTVVGASVIVVGHVVLSLVRSCEGGLYYIYRHFVNPNITISGLYFLF